jgi:hypothetical protein
MTKKHVPPARMRWAARNRTIGVTVPLEVYDHLLKVRARYDKSFGRLFKEALDVLERDLEGARLQGQNSGIEKGQRAGYKAGHEAGHGVGYGAGYQQAESEFKVMFTCPKCGTSTPLHPGTETTDAMLKTLAAAGWAHGECIDRHDDEEEE